VGIGLSGPAQGRREQKARRAARWPIAVWLILAMGFGVLALWVSGFEPLLWWRAHEQAVSAKAAQPQRAPAGPISIVQPTPLGTDSSISRVPLPLHLTATRLGRNSREGYADIGVNVLSPQTYEAGAILANGARLEEIYSDNVVVERDSQKSRLYIEGRALQSNTAPVSATLLTVGGASPVPSAVADSRDTLTDAIRIAPLFDGDYVRALELYPGAQSNLFERLGFKPGDQVIAIDGAAVKDFRKAITALRQVTAGAAIVLTIERGGKDQDLSVDGSIFQSNEPN